MRARRARRPCTGRERSGHAEDKDGSQEQRRDRSCEYRVSRSTPPGSPHRPPPSTRRRRVAKATSSALVADFGGPANSTSPVALRPPLTGGLPFRSNQTMPNRSTPKQRILSELRQRCDSKLCVSCVLTLFRHASPLEDQVTRRTGSPAPSRLSRHRAFRQRRPFSARHPLSLGPIPRRAALRATRSHQRGLRIGARSVSLPGRWRRRSSAAATTGRSRWPRRWH
jgi:hypothetical protein